MACPAPAQGELTAAIPAPGGAPAGQAPIVAALCLLAVGPARSQERAEVEAGRKLAELHCSRCHAVGNEGASLMEGAPPLRDIKLRYPVDDLAEALAEGMETAHPQMPVFTFSPRRSTSFWLISIVWNSRRSGPNDLRWCRRPCD